MEATFELRVGTADAAETCLVLSFTGRERLSHVFRFEIDVLCEETALDGFVGEPAALFIHSPARPVRVISGLVESVRQSSRALKSGGRYRVTLVPRLASLRHRSSFRVFQDRTVPEIVSAVLEQYGLPCTHALHRTYARRAYCVQYRERDLAFVERLLEEEGIFYRFDTCDYERACTSGPEDTLVLVDHAERSPSTEPLQLTLRDGGTAAAVDDLEVFRFAASRAIRPTAASVRDYDFQRPRHDLVGRAKLADEGSSSFEVETFRGDFEGPDADDERATMVLDQLRRGALVADGASNCRALTAGGTFRLVCEEASRLAGDYRVTEVRHRGAIPEVATSDAPVYRNELRAVPSEVVPRPRRRRRTLENVLATAVVVGPEAEEIHTDAHGRVKVQFHWDDRGPRDENSSYWIRVMQAWSGAAYGSQFVPRVGMEVLVSFLGGDHDCPVVIGCVPNPVRPVPFPLPQQKTKSGFRTQSSPGGGGFNELSFEDKRGEEQIYLHAQRNLEELIEHDHLTSVLGCASLTVKKSQSVKVEGDAREAIAGEAAREVGKDEKTTVGKNRVDVVHGNADVRIGEACSTKVGGREVREVKGRSDLEVGADYTIRSRGCMTTIVGRHDKKRSYVLRVEGRTQLSASEGMEIEAEKGLVLRCGKSFIKISEDRIELVAPSVAVRGEGAGLSAEDGKLKIRAKEKTLLTAKELLLKTDDASVGLKKDVEVAGRKILLNSPLDAKDPVKDESAPPTRIQLKDPSGAPLAYQRFRIKLANGAEYSAILDKNGEIDMELDQSGVIEFPDASAS